MHYCHRDAELYYLQQNLGVTLHFAMLYPNIYTRVHYVESPATSWTVVLCWVAMPINFHYILYSAVHVRVLYYVQTILLSQTLLLCFYAHVSSITFCTVLWKSITLCEVQCHKQTALCEMLSLESCTAHCIMLNRRVGVSCSHATVGSYRQSESCYTLPFHLLQLQI
jgi:hypothetical protein